MTYVCSTWRLACSSPLICWDRAASDLSRTCKRAFSTLTWACESSGLCVRGVFVVVARRAYL